MRIPISRARPARALMLAGMLLFWAPVARGASGNDWGEVPIRLTPNATTALTISVASNTPTSLSIRWRLRGDVNLNAAAGVDYRRHDAASAAPWQDAQPLLRVEPRTHPRLGIHAGNRLSGSLVGLAPGTAYDIRLTLTDPDGGGEIRRVTFWTRPAPRRITSGRTELVKPGGLAAALRTATPGTVLALAPGLYRGPFVLTMRAAADLPLVIAASAPGPVTLDGGNAATLFRARGVTHVTFIGLTFTNARELLDLTGSRDVSVQRCRFTRFTRRALVARHTEHLRIEDCRLDGRPRRGTRLAGARPAGRQTPRTRAPVGISLSGSGAVVTHNAIADCATGIVLGGDGDGDGDGIMHVTRALEVSNNAIDRTTVGIRIARVQDTVRVVRNAVRASGAALACGATFGGPVSLVGNALVSTAGSALVLSDAASGLLVYGNSLFGARHAIGGGPWRHGRFRNNVCVGLAGQALDTSGARADFAFNGWYGGAGFGRFGRRVFATRAQFEQAMGGAGARTLSAVAFRQVRPLSAPWPATAAADSGVAASAGETGATGAGVTVLDLRLVPGAAAIDAGIVLPNVGGAITGAAPDLGAYEAGLPPPVYGPRPRSQQDDDFFAQGTRARDADGETPRALASPPHKHPLREDGP